jgi:formylglycine-generating enzyme required for sulfatase activity
LTNRYYGETDELLGKYAWYAKNSKKLTWPVGTKKPNDFGLFDTHGNCYTWCQGLDYSDSDDVGNKIGSRPLRGGSFTNLASDVRVSHRTDVSPNSRAFNVGFRPARTITAFTAYKEAIRRGP